MYRVQQIDHIILLQILRPIHSHHESHPRPKTHQSQTLHTHLRPHSTRALIDNSYPPRWVPGADTLLHRRRPSAASVRCASNLPRPHYPQSITRRRRRGRQLLAT
jgi:hypothetical protein